MQIAIFANGLFPYVVGGMQKFTSLSTKYLALAGVRCHLFYIQENCYSSALEVHDRLFDGSELVSLYPVKPPRKLYFPGHYYLTSWRQSACLVNAYLESNISADFIYSHGYAGWRACQLRKKKGYPLPPVGVHGHGLEALQEEFSWWRSAKNSFAPIWQKQILRLADFNLSLGGEIDDVIFQVTARRDNIISARNGIDDSWLNLSPRAIAAQKPIRFLFVGRDSARKGFHELNEATSNLLNQGAELELHVVGPVSEPNKISHPKIGYHGKVTDEESLKKHYQACDVLLVPSHSEGMPTVILEAMANGLAIIASDVGAVRTAVNNSNGWIISPRNVAQLQKAMQQATLEDLGPKKQMSFQKANKQTWKMTVTEFVTNPGLADLFGRVIKST
jgi:glycosyltransferase involved in cell wall biosynthesis